MTWDSVLEALGVEKWELWFLSATLILSVCAGCAKRLTRARGSFVFEGVEMLILILSIGVTGTVKFVRETFGSGTAEDPTEIFIKTVGYDLIVGTLGFFVVGPLVGVLILSAFPSVEGAPISHEDAEKPLGTWLDERTERQRAVKTAERSSIETEGQHVLSPDPGVVADDRPKPRAETAAQRLTATKWPKPPWSSLLATTTLILVGIALLYVHRRRQNSNCRR